MLIQTVTVGYCDKLPGYGIWQGDYIGQDKGSVDFEGDRHL